ncbi:MAG: ABC transporter ATP-binding protein [Deltaproteobacteria bacterium]|nr:ABC transporter ATP-binding protein [Deltaproteobacteria bacterium]
MSDLLLQMEGVAVAYHRVVTAIQGVSLRIRRRQIVALLGSNGAGKTTTLRAISGFLGLDQARVTEGTIRYGGDAIENRAPYEVASRGIALVPERSKIFENLTVAENLEANVARPGADRKRLEAAVYEYFPPLRRLKNREAGYLSGGERQMLGIGSALMCAPELLLIDELSLGLAPLVVTELMGRLRAVRDELGTTLLVVEQNAQVALEVADYAYVLENGRVALEGTAEDLLADRGIRESYLGQGQAERRSYRDVKQYRRTRRWWG